MRIVNATLQQQIVLLNGSEDIARTNLPSGILSLEDGFRQRVTSYSRHERPQSSMKSIRQLCNSGGWQSTRTDRGIQGSFSIHTLETAGVVIVHSSWMLPEEEDDTLAFQRLRAVIDESVDHTLQVILAHARLPDGAADPEPHSVALALDRWLESVRTKEDGASTVVCDPCIARAQDIRRELGSGLQTAAEEDTLWIVTGGEGLRPYSRWAFLCRGDAYETWLTKDFLNVGLTGLSVAGLKAHTQLAWYRLNKTVLDEQSRSLEQLTRRVDENPSHDEHISPLHSLGRVAEQNLLNVQRRFLTIEVNLNNLQRLAPTLGLDLAGDLGAPLRDLRRHLDQAFLDAAYFKNTLENARSSVGWVERPAADQTEPQRVNLLSHATDWQAVSCDDWEKQNTELVGQIQAGMDILTVDHRCGQDIIYSPKAPNGLTVTGAEVKRLEYLVKLIVNKGRWVLTPPGLNPESFAKQMRDFRLKFDKRIDRQGREYVWVGHDVRDGRHRFCFRHAAADWYLAMDASTRLDRFGSEEGNR